MSMPPPPPPPPLPPKQEAKPWLTTPPPPEQTIGDPQKEPYGFYTGNTHAVGRRSSPRPKQRALPTPEDVLDSGYAYLRWCINNPVEGVKTGVYKGEAFNYERKSPRMPSLHGWASFIGISQQSVSNWFIRTKDPEYKAAAQEIRTMIETMQIEMAAAEFVNPMIAARLLGLVEKSEVRQRELEVEVEVVPVYEQALLVHPDDPDPENATLLFTQEQLDAGMPYPVALIKQPVEDAEVVE